MINLVAFQTLEFCDHDKLKNIDVISDGEVMELVFVFTVE